MRVQWMLTYGQTSVSSASRGLAALEREQSWNTLATLHACAHELRRTGKRLIDWAQTFVLAVGSACVTATASAQQQLDAVEVQGHYTSGAPAPGQWRWDTTLHDWSWIGEDGNAGAPPVDTPSIREACAAADEVWQANGCDSNYAPIAVNGCGPGGVIGLVVPDSFEHISFSQACNKHDACYSTLGSERSGCDFDIEADILEACAEGRVHWRAWCSDNPADGVTNSGCVQEMDYQCTGRAAAYRGAVASLGLNFFQAAQASARCQGPNDVRQLYGCERP